MTVIGATTDPRRLGHQPTIHSLDGETWATCTCGWTSSEHDHQDLEQQIVRHLKPWSRP